MEQKIGAVDRMLRLEAAEQQLLEAAQAAEALGDCGTVIAKKIQTALSAIKE